MSEQRDATSRAFTVEEINGIRVEFKNLMEAMVDMAKSNGQPIIEIMQVQRDAPPTIDQLCDLAIKGLSAPSERGEFEVLRVERDKARAMYERAISHLTRIHAFLNPPIVEVGGKTYRFNNPDANETLQALSDAIRAIPEDLRSVPSARGCNCPRCGYPEAE